MTKSQLIKAVSDKIERILDLKKDKAALECKLKLCVEVLREIEFAALMECPYCYNDRQEGHASDCRLAKALEKAKK